MSDRLKMQTTEFNSLQRTVNSLLYERISINDSLSKLTDFTDKLSVSIGLNGFPLTAIPEQSMSKGEDIQGRSASAIADPTQLQMIPFSTPLTSSTPSSAHPSTPHRVQITRVLRDGAIVNEDGEIIGHEPRPTLPLSLSGSRQSRHTTANQSTVTKKRRGSSSASQQKRTQRRATEIERDRVGAHAEHTNI